MHCTLAYRNRCTECPNAWKSIGNRFLITKYIGAVGRKSFELEIVAEIGSFQIFYRLQKKTHKINEKDSLKKIKTISILFGAPWQPHSESGGTQFLQKMSASALQGTDNHTRNAPPTPPHTYSDNTATAGATVSNEQLMALFEKPATAKRFVDTCCSSLFYKRTPRHVENPLSF